MNGIAHRPAISTLQGVARTVGLCLAIVASLAVFPAGLHWMVAAWIVAYLWFVWRRRQGWIALAICLAIVLVKRAAWIPGLAACLLVILAAVACGIGRARGWPRWLLSGRFLAVEAMLVSLSWIVFAWDWTASATASHARALDRERPIVCLGDSLTSGIEPDPGYPEQLGQLVRVGVVNLGRAGISTKDGLKMLPKLKAVRPQAVIIELGGHDFLKGYSREATKANLRAMVQAARESDAEPILMEVPRGFITDPYSGLERELAREEDLELIADTAIRRLVLWSPFAPPGMWTGGPYLSDDGLHPNAAGNAELAQTAAGALKRVFGAEIAAAR